MEIKFAGYTHTPGERHLGIASIIMGDKILLRFKVVATKDGSSFFAVEPSLRVPEGTEYRYLPAFLIDSRVLQQEIEEVIRKNVSPLFLSLQSGSAEPSALPSGFSSSPAPLADSGKNQWQDEQLPF